jgi:hypothetical protein
MARKPPSGQLDADTVFLIRGSVYMGSATTFGQLERLGIDFSEIGILGWCGILWGLSFVWLGLNVWYFCGRWGMIPRTS